MRRYITSGKPSTSRLRASPTFSIATGHTDADRPQPDVPCEDEVQCHFGAHDTPVLQHRPHRGAPNRLLRGILTAMQFPQHPNQHSCAALQDPIPHDDEQAAALRRPQLAYCPHTVEKGWRIKKCRGHEQAGQPNHYVCEWHTYHNRKGGYDSKSALLKH